MIDIDKLQAGPDLDAFVAEKMMGWTEIDLKWRGEAFHSGVPLIGKGTSPNGGICGIPHFSTDITAAWEIVEKMMSASSVQWKAWLRELKGGEVLLRGKANGDAPLAICRAALKAMEADK